MIYQIILITNNLYRKDLECEVHSEVSFFLTRPYFLFTLKRDITLNDLSYILPYQAQRYYEGHPFAAEVDEYDIYTVKNANRY